MLQASEAEAGADSRCRIMAACRKLFGSKCFHSTPMAELAIEAKVGVGQIYRHFPGKDHIILAIVEEDTRAHLDVLEHIFAAAERGEMSFADAIEHFAYNALTKPNQSLSFEIIAESYRNERVLSVVLRLLDHYRALVGQLASRVRPDLGERELDACVEITIACFHGLGLLPSIHATIDPKAISRATACLIMRGIRAVSHPIESRGISTASGFWWGRLIAGHNASIFALDRMPGAGSSWRSA